jgi:2-keto-4-pentenoate hydratase/2-oxohepta-3-ene-1,7-dioic acid hydratase in catechol pathway
MSREVHHEVELVAVIGRMAHHISEDEAMEHIAAYAVGLDMTARDLQARAKRLRAPWCVAKGFDTFCPVGDEAPAPRDLRDLTVVTRVNGRERQREGGDQHEGEGVSNPTAHLGEGSGSLAPWTLCLRDVMCPSCAESA